MLYVYISIFVLIILSAWHKLLEKNKYINSQYLRSLEEATHFFAHFNNFDDYNNMETKRSN